ncbi:MAG: glucose-6-phosphate isomerase [Hyphomicrobiaceae bacterium]
MSGSSSAALMHQDVGGCLDAAVPGRGLPRTSLERRLALLKPHLADLATAAESGALPLLSIVSERDDVTAAAAALARLSEGGDTLVFFGTGGSSLGGQTLAQLAGWNIPGSASASQLRRPRTRFYDNFDPDTLERALASMDLARARFVVTSKSGTTVETLTQAVAAMAAVRAAGHGAHLDRHFLFVTEPDRPGVRNGLRALAGEFAIPVLDHHTGIGGRYSVLSNVGLLPAMARGLDPLAIRDGARSVVEAMIAARDPADVPAAIGAATTVGLAEDCGVHVLVMMPYADRLGRFGHWYVQLWAESLGKGGKGTTPLAALGPLDQHSQLQLFMDGPPEHMLTILRVAPRGRGTIVDADLARRGGLEALAGRPCGDLVAAQGEAIAEALREAGRPVRTIDIPRLDERSMGALLMHFMLETILAARLMGIDPFDQPGVELAKRLTRDRLGRSN